MWQGGNLASRCSAQSGRSCGPEAVSRNWGENCWKAAKWAQFSLLFLLRNPQSASCNCARPQLVCDCLATAFDAELAGKPAGKLERPASRGVWLAADQ